MTSHYSSHDQSYNNSHQPGLLPVYGRRGGGATNRGSTSRSRGKGTSERVLVVMCNCGDEAVERTVQKDGPNKGKQFFVCGKPRDQQCQYFEWSSNLPDSSVRSYSSSRVGQGNSGRDRGRRGGQVSWRASTHRGDDDEDVGTGGRKKRAPPTCSMCREVGHTKRSCPLNH